ncbi:MAG: alpha/beta hydrolase [Paludibacteraceae bacterium]|nr:alpha/beta hydrolase [Paludibacteraceae bacterium]
MQKVIFPLLAAMLTACTATTKEHEYMKVTYHQINVDNCTVFYREAGSPDKPTLLLLHGFPSASHMFRDLMPLLADKYHLIAPDMPSFGQTVCPSRSEQAYTFDYLASTIDHFTEVLRLDRFAMYIFDYGAPVGLRIAMWHPERVTAIISQNGNCYEEGLGKKWEARKDYWQHPTPELRAQYASAYALETIIGQYTFGTPEGSVAPDGYTLDFAYVQLPERAEMQNDLIFDYQSNVALYPQFQAYLREHQPRLLAVWGENDPSFIPAGANAFKRDLSNAEIHFVPSGHFALESHAAEIAKYIRSFLKNN